MRKNRRKQQLSKEQNGKKEERKSRPTCWNGRSYFLWRSCRILQSRDTSHHAHLSIKLSTSTLWRNPNANKAINVKNTPTTPDVFVTCRLGFVWKAAWPTDIRNQISRMKALTRPRPFILFFLFFLSLFWNTRAWANKHMRATQAYSNTHIYPGINMCSNTLHCLLLLFVFPAHFFPYKNISIENF